MNKWVARQSGYSVSGRGDGPFYWEVFEDGKLGKRITALLTRDDAILVAAAPEMLEALKAVIAYREGRNPYQWLETWGELERQIRAAIAKAEGK